MNNTLPTIIQDSEVVLSRSKNLIGITNKILASRSSVLAEVLVKKPFVSMGHTGAITSVAFSPDGNTVLSGSQDKTLKLWDVHSGGLIRTFESHTKAITSVAFSPDGNTVLSGSVDATLKLWDVHSGELIRTFSSAKTFEEWMFKKITSVAFSPDGNTVLSGNQDRTLTLWDIHSGELIWSIYNNQRDPSVAFSPDGDSVLSASWNETLTLWDVHSGELIRRYNLLDEHSEKLIQIFNRETTNGNSSIAFSPDGNTVLFGGGVYWSSSSYDDGDIIFTLKLLDLQSGEVIRKFNLLDEQRVSVAFSPDGNTVLSGSDLWDAHSGNHLHIFDGHTEEITSVTFSPDGNLALSGSRDKTLKLWDVHSGSLIRTFEGHTRGVTSVAFSPNTVLSGSEDNTLKLCYPHNDKELGTMIVFSDGEWVAITPDGYFNHSPNGRKYLLINPTDMSADVIDDTSYNHYYRPNGLLREHDTSSNLPEIEINEDEIPI